MRRGEDDIEQQETIIHIEKNNPVHLAWLLMNLSYHKVGAGVEKWWRAEGAQDNNRTCSNSFIPNKLILVMATEQ